MKFRKLPIEIEAKQFPNSGPEQQEIAKWVETNGGVFHLYDGYYKSDVKTSTEANWHWDGGFVETLEGCMKVNIGDWVIKGIENEFYCCRKDIFEKNYEPVE